MNNDWITTFWFIIVGVLFSGFFFLEGFDYGVGMSAITVAKDKREVEQAIDQLVQFGT